MKPVLVSDEARKVWKLASGFPPDKEAVYPEHGKVQEFDLHHGKQCLDYGCGGGPDTMSFLRRGNEVWYADVVPENIQTTTERVRAMGCEGRAHPVPLEYSAPIPLPSASLDVVSSHGVLHHIPEVLPVVTEFFRLLRSGSLCYVMLYTEVMWERFLPEMRRRIERGLFKSYEAAFCSLTDPGGPSYARPYTDQEGRDLLTGAGFEMVSSPLWNDRNFRTFKAQKP